MGRMLMGTMFYENYDNEKKNAKGGYDESDRRERGSIQYVEDRVPFFSIDSFWDGSTKGDVGS